MNKTYPLFRYVRAILALSIVFLTFGINYCLIFVELSEGSRDSLQQANGFSLALAAAVANYYFGSSKDKSDAEQATRDNDPKNQQS